MMTPETVFAGFRLMPRHTDDLSLMHCGMETCLPQKLYQDEVRLEYVIHFVVSGKGIYCLRGQEYQIGPAQAFLIPPDTADYYYEADKDDPFFYMWIGFSGKMALSYLNRTGLSYSTPVCCLAQGCEPFYSEMLRLLSLQGSSYSDELRRTGCLCHILSLLIHSHESLQNDPDTYQYPSQVYVQYAVEAIRTANGCIHISDVAEQIGIDRRYLHTVFRKHLGLSPQEYLMSFRLRLSCRLLTATDISLQSIANKIGYEDAASFSKMFKKQFGMSPSAYRKSNAPERRILL